MTPALLLLLLLAQPANPYLDEARRLAKDLQFAEAIEQLKVARQVPQLSNTQRLEVLELLGRCQVAEGARADAEASFADMLAMSPGAELNRGASPKILEVFDAVKKRLYAPDFVRLNPLPARLGQAVLLIVDPWHRVEALVMLRRLDGAAPTEQPVPVADGQAAIELDVAPGHALEWWLEARDVSGLPLAGFGSAQSPQRFAQPAVVTSGLFAPGPERTPRLQRAPAWVAVALTVGAGAAGAFLQVRSQDRANQARTKEWSDDARALHASAVTDATIATGLFIGAGVAGATGVVLFAW